MAGISRKSDHIADDKKRVAMDELIRFFEKERDEVIGRIAAEQLLSFFLETVGPEIYNQGIRDAKSALENRMDELRYDFDELLDT